MKLPKDVAEQVEAIGFSIRAISRPGVPDYEIEGGLVRVHLGGGRGGKWHVEIDVLFEGEGAIRIPCLCPGPHGKVTIIDRWKNDDCFPTSKEQALRLAMAVSADPIPFIEKHIESVHRHIVHQQISLATDQRRVRKLENWKNLLPEIRGVTF